MCIPKPVASLNRIPQYPLRKLIIKVMKRKAEQPHHLLLPLLLLLFALLSTRPKRQIHQIPRRIHRIHRPRHKPQMLTPLRRRLPRPHMRMQVREHEHGLFPLITLLFALHLPIPSDPPIQIFLDPRRRSPRPAREINIHILGDVTGTEGGEEGVRDEGGGRAGLDEGEGEGPGEG